MRKYIDLVLNEILQVVDGIDDKKTAQFVRALKGARRIYIAGVGRSGLVVKAFGQRMMHLGHEVHLADEITAPGIGKRDLLVCCSGTGKTQLTVYMARKARSIGAKTVSLTAVPNSSLARLSDIVITIPAPLEPGGRKGIETYQPARSLFEQALLVYLDAVVLGIIDKYGIPKERVAQRHGNLE